MTLFITLSLILFIASILIGVFFPEHFEIISSSEELLIEEKTLSVAIKFISMLSFFLLIIVAFLEDFSQIYFIILGVIFFLLALRWVFRKDKFLLKKRTLTIDKGSCKVILPDSQIKFEEMKSLEFTVVSDGESSSTVIKLILRNGKKVNLLAVERKKEAKVIYKFIYDILKLEGIYRIERGWLDDIVKEIDFV